MPRFQRTRRLYVARRAPSGCAPYDEPSTKEVRLRPVLIALAALVVCVVVGVVLYALDFVVLGIVAFLAGIPVALVAWVVANDR
jgi:hypothetical protein